MLGSDPVQFTLSSQIGPTPAPYLSLPRTVLPINLKQQKTNRSPLNYGIAV